MSDGQKRITAILAGSAVLLLFIFLVVLPLWSGNVELVEVSLDAQKQVLDKLGQRTTITISTTGNDGVLGLVGLVLVTDSQSHDSTQFNRQSVLPQFRPEKTALEVVPLGNLLYEGRVSNELGAGGSYAKVAGKLKRSQIAEIVIKDDVYFGLSGTKQIPFKDLREYIRTDAKKDKRYFFVESATLTSTVYRTFEEAEGKAGGGTVFKANGRIYAASEGYAIDSVVSVEVWDLAALEGSEAGAESTVIPTLVHKQISGQITTEESAKLRQALSESDDGTPSELGSIDLSDIDNATHTISFNDLPLSLDRLKYNYRVPGVIPHLRQPSAHTCWATVGTMLANWNTGAQEGIEAYLRSVDDHYAELFRSDKPLGRVDKKSFLHDAGLEFDYGMSYHPDGLLQPALITCIS